MISNLGRAVFRGRIEAVTALFGGNMYIGFSADNTATAVGDTTLPGEITTNGLGRQLATLSHTTGTNVWTWTVTATYTGSTPTTVNKIALFDAASSGNLLSDYLASTGTTFSNAGDNSQYSITISL